MNDKLLARRQVADFMGQKPKWVYANVPHIKLGKYRRWKHSTVLEYMFRMGDIADINDRASNAEQGLVRDFDADPTIKDDSAKIFTRIMPLPLKEVKADSKPSGKS